jgi:GNAT superfamily N-acetyltransferase
MKIRAASSDDADAIVVLLHELGYSTARETVVRHIDCSGTDPIVLVAELEGQVAGLATGHMLPVIHEERPLAMLTALVVREGVRGNGLGWQLVTAIEAWAREQGANRIVVTSGLARTDAHAFYERIGYEHTAHRFSRSL